MECAASPRHQLNRSYSMYPHYELLTDLPSQKKPAQVSGVWVKQDYRNVGVQPSLPLLWYMIVIYQVYIL